MELTKIEKMILLSLFSTDIAYWDAIEDLLGKEVVKKLDIVGDYLEDTKTSEELEEIATGLVKKLVSSVIDDL